MTILSNKELKRHEYLASALLLAAFLLWAVGAWFRAYDRWVPEYPHSMIALAAVALFGSLSWRCLAYAQTLWRKVPIGNFFLRMQIYLAAYSVCILIGASWLEIEKRLRPQIAWAPEQSVALTVLYALLIIALPWILVFALKVLSGKK